MLKRLVFVGLLVSLFAAGLFAAGCSKEKEETTSGPTPSGSPAPGVTDTQILLGTHLPLSNSPAAAYAPAADGMRAYFDYINSQGGVYGRKVKLIVADDHFSPPDALEAVRRLVEQDGVLAIVGGLGDPTVTAIKSYLEQNGVPDLWVAAGLPSLSDPVEHTRFVVFADYATGANVDAAYLKENYPGKTLGIVVENSASGTSGENALLNLLKDSGIKVVSRQLFESTSFDLTGQMQRMKADNPDVIYIAGNAGASANAVKVTREVLDWDAPIFMSGIGAIEMTIALAGAKNMEGVVAETIGKMFSEKDDPGVKLHIDLMKQFTPEVTPSSITEFGMAQAEYTVEALKNAGPNLTRESLIDGAEKIRDFCCLTCLVPVNLSPTDHRVAETFWYEKVVNGQWVRFGDPISFESTPGGATACKGPGEPVYPGE